jgi:hypothetical protein
MIPVATMIARIYAVIIALIIVRQGGAGLWASSTSDARALQSQDKVTTFLINIVVVDRSGSAEAFISCRACRPAFPASRRAPLSAARRADFTPS